MPQRLKSRFFGNFSIRVTLGKYTMDFNEVLIIQLLDQCTRSKKISPLRHACLATLGTCVKEVQFYCLSSTYPAISYCTIFPFLAHVCSITWYKDAKRPFCKAYRKTTVQGHIFVSNSLSTIEKCHDLRLIFDQYAHAKPTYH